MDNFTLVLQVTISVSIFNTPTCGQANRRIRWTMYRALYLLVKTIDIDRPLHIPIGRTIGGDQ